MKIHSLVLLCVISIAVTVTPTKPRAQTQPAADDDSLYEIRDDVMIRTHADAGEPLRVKWHNDSYIDVPLSEE